MLMTREPLSPAEARAALDTLDETRARIAALGVCPPWRHAAFGVIMALLVGGTGFPLPIQTSAMALAFGLMAVVFVYDRRRYGVFINGYRKGATRPFTFALLGVMLGLLVLQIWLRDRHAADVVHLAIAAVAFAVGTTASVIWARLFRRDLERRV